MYSMECPYNMAKGSHFYGNTSVDWLLLAIYPAAIYFFKYLSTTVRLPFKSSSYNIVIAFRGLADHVVGRLWPGIRCLSDVLLRVPSMTEHKKLNPRAETFLL